MCDIEIDELSEMWDETEVKARKPHKCTCCRRVIQPGEKYIRHFSVFEGECNPAKLCRDCNDDRMAFAEEHGMIIPHPDGFIGMLHDCISDGDEDDQRWRDALVRIKERSEQ